MPWRLRDRFTSPLWRAGFFFAATIVAILGPLFWELPSWAQGPPSSPTLSRAASEVELKEEETAEKIWLAHRELLRKGDWTKSQGELEKLYQWKLNQGIPNHYLYALALIRESQDIAREGDPEAIPDLLNFAEKMAPDFSQVAFARARWLWSQNPFSLDKAGKAVWHWYQGVLRSFYNFEEALPQIASLTFWILLSFLVTFGAFSCSLMFRYFPFFTHQLKHLVPLEIPPMALGALSILILFSPFFLGARWMWLFILWLLLFGRMSHRADRAVSIALLAGLLLLPNAIRIYSSFLTSLTENGVPEITRANMGAWSVDLHRKLVALKQINPRDPDILQALGLVEKRMGKFAEAEQNVLQWTQLQPNASQAFNNLGNVYLATHRPIQAVEAYKKALQLGTSKAESHYNLGQAYLLNLLLSEAEAEFRRANELKPQLISYYTSISSRNPNRMVIDQTIEPLQLWKRVFLDNPEREKIAQGYWEFLWHRVPLKYGEVTVAAILGLLVLMQILTGNRPLIRNCERCGRLICYQCTRSMVMGKYCSQCVTAFSARRSADPQVVKHKRAEVSKYQSRRRSLTQWFSLVIPGVGHLLLGRGKEGTIYLFLLILFLIKLIWRQEWVPSPLVLNIWPSTPWIIATGFFFSVYYGFVQYRMTRILSKGR
jgi:tetratricopeptide (TPR) repeat protein